MPVRFAILMPITRQQASREIRVNPRGVLTLIKARSSLEEFKTPTFSPCENVLNSVLNSVASPRSLKIIITNHYRRVISLSDEQSTPILGFHLVEIGKINK